MKINRKGKKSIKIGILVLICILVIFLGLIIVEVVRELHEEKVLKQEVIAYSNKNLATDNFNIKIKTKGDYAYVEEAIKQFYKQLSDNVKTANSYLHNQHLTNILSPQSLINDRPDFSLSHVTITNTKDNLNKIISNIKQLCEEKTIKNWLDKDKLDDSDYYYNLYLQLMYTDKDKKQFQDIKAEMEQLSVSLDNYLNTLDGILTFLTIHDNEIQYSDNLYFSSDGVYKEYKQLISNLNLIINNSTNNNTDQV